MSVAATARFITGAIDILKLRGLVGLLFIGVDSGDCSDSDSSILSIS